MKIICGVLSAQIRHVHTVPYEQACGWQWLIPTIILYNKFNNGLQLRIFKLRKCLHFWPYLVCTFNNSAPRNKTIDPPSPQHGLEHPWPPLSMQHVLPPSLPVLHELYSELPHWSGGPGPQEGEGQVDGGGNGDGGNLLGGDPEIRPQKTRLNHKNDTCTCATLIRQNIFQLQSSLWPARTNCCPFVSLGLHFIYSIWN